MTKQQQIDTLQKQLDAANEQIANIDNALKEQYLNTATKFGQYVKYNVIKNDYTHCENCRQAEIEETRYQELDKLKTQVARIQSKVDKLEYKVNKKDV